MVRAAQTPLGCLVCGDHGGVDVVLNLILFVPLGLGLRLAGWPWQRVVGAAALLSFTVEALQFLAVVGRDASLSDLLTNTMGGALGATLAPRLPAMVLPASDHARRLLLGGAAAWVTALAISAWLLAAGTSDGALKSYWSPFGPEPHPFTGAVRAVTLDGLALPPRGAPRDTATLRDRLDRGEVRLGLRGISGMPPRRGEWIYMISAGTQPQLFVTQKGTSATVAVPARALRLRLRAPALRLPAALPEDAGISFYLAGGRREDLLRVEVSHGGTTRAAELSLSPSHGWVLIAPFGLPFGRSVRLVTAVCIAAVILPLGYWAAAIGRPRWGITVLTLALLGGLVAVPGLAGYRPVHWSEWLAAILAGAGGWALHRRAAYLELRCGSPSTSVSSSS